MKIKDLVFKEVVKSGYSFQIAVGISRNFSIEKNEKTGEFLCDYSCFDTFQDAVNYCNKINYESYLMKIKEVEEMKSKWEVK